MARVSQKIITGRRERQQQCRLEAAGLFEAGRTRAEVATGLGVSWRAAHSWYQAWKAGGSKELEAKTKPCPVPRFSDVQVEELKAEMVRGSLGHGYANELWTLRRVARLILERFGLRTSPSGVWRLLRRMKWSPHPDRYWQWAGLPPRQGNLLRSILTKPNGW